MADLWKTTSRRGVGAGHVDDRAYGVGAAAALTAAYRRNAVRFVAGSARDAEDPALLLSILGLEPVEGRDGTEKVA